MNEHEIGRLAAALNQARPDWPVKQLKTLLSDDRIASRPRRDVFVALAWIACETASASPYRVLEAGPWWRAAAIEGQAQAREPFDDTAFCGVCGEPRDRCQRKWAGDHEFESVAHARQRKGEHDISPVVAEVKGHVEPTKPRPEPAERTRSPRVEQVREVLHPTTETRAPDGEMEETNR